MKHALAPLIALPLLALAGCGAVPNPNEYGGGAKGKTIAKCIVRTERADASITREQSAEMCTCVADTMMAQINGGGGVSQSTLRRCATDAGITID